MCICLIAYQDSVPYQDELKDNYDSNVCQFQVYLLPEYYETYLASTHYR